MELSIIIPVYNTEINILKRCLNSVLKLVNIKYEILLIDDGSDIEKCQKYKEYIQNIDCIRYIYKENGGVSSARNLGIDEAIGKYIMFVDSDDIIYAEEITREHLYSDKDIIFYNKKYITYNQEYMKKEIKKNTGNVEWTYIVRQIINNDSTFHEPWGKIIRLDFLRRWHIKFDINIIQGEDVIFNIEMLMCSPNLYYVDKYLYGYYLDFKTVNTRVVKFPSQMFENLKVVYYKKKQAIKKLECDDESILVASLEIYYLNKIFSFCISLCEGNNIETFNTVSDYIDELKYEKLKFGNKAKFYLIKRKRWYIIKIISKIRPIYLKYFKKNY